MRTTHIHRTHAGEDDRLWFALLYIDDDLTKSPWIYRQLAACAVCLLATGQKHAPIIRIETQVIGIGMDLMLLPSGQLHSQHDADYAPQSCEKSTA